MKIGITGSKGYIGSQLTKRLESEGHEVLQFDRPNFDILKDALDFETINLIVHLAALTSVVESWNSPSDYLNVNVGGTLKVLESANKYKIPIIFFSSYVYGHPIYLPIDEKHPIEAYNPYSLSKIMGESLCEFYRSVQKLPITIIRPFNVYGPGQSENFVISAIINQLFTESPEIVMNDLSPKRDYIYIDDLINMVYLTILNPINEPINGCSGVSYSVEELVNICQSLAGTNKKVLSKNLSRKNEITDIVGSNKTALLKIGWEPAYDIRSGILECINHVKNAKL